MALDASTLILAAIGAAVLYGIWTTANPRLPIKIVVTPAGVRSHRGLPKRAIGRVVEFLEQDVNFDRTATILAGRDRNGRLRTRFKGVSDAGTEQRIRNFLIAEL